MTRTHLLDTTILASAAAALALAIPSAALAQDNATQPAGQQTGATPEQAAADAADSSEESIVVTGSRIPHALNETSNVPVTSLSAGELTNTGKVNIGDTLNQLPSLRSTFSQQNSTRFLGTAGLNLLDLRGLGPQRTLVLVNGRRHVAGDILSTGVSVDINTIPTDLIQRVDVVTGGDSAVYGSDAIAGVVNFVLRQDYQGLQVRGQGGISTYGDMSSYFGSVLWGTHFSDGRGNVTVNLEYARQDAAYASQRPNLRHSDIFVTVDSDPP